MPVRLEAAAKVGDSRSLGNLVEDRLHILGSSLPAPSRYHRRYGKYLSPQDTPPIIALAAFPNVQPRFHHLGEFEGERKRNSHGYTDPYSLPKALTSFLSIAAALLAAALLLGALP